MARTGRPPRPLAQRLAERVVELEGCLVFRGSGINDPDGRHRSPTRAAWIARGRPEPPPGYVVARACSTPGCVEHLEVLSRRDLQRRTGRRRRERAAA